MSSTNDFVIEHGVLTKYTGSEGDVVIPEGVTTIGDGAFFWLHQLERRDHSGERDREKGINAFDDGAALVRFGTRIPGASPATRSPKTAKPGKTQTVHCMRQPAI